MEKRHKQRGYKSDEEMWFADWCQEAGIKAEYEKTTFELAKEVRVLVTGSKKPAHLLQDVTYTADFTLYAITATTNHDVVVVDILRQPIQTMPKKALFVAFGDKIYVEVKGSNYMSSQRSSDVTFKVKQKWVMSVFGVYVNPVVPDKLFEQTFYPESWFWTDNGKERCKKVNGKLVPYSQIYKRFNQWKKE